jgi:2-polyprenyl-6-hydroxyphenyl methylase/3-demethylubiquinone-9 3-methyltransferase
LLKRWIEKLAVTTAPGLANHARYPAVNWFSFFQLRDFLAPLGFVECLDRFDVLARQPLSPAKRLVTRLATCTGAARVAAQVLTNGSTVWALKRGT